MILNQSIVIVLTAAANQQVSLTRINTQGLIFKARQSNGATARVGMPAFNEQTGAFAAPTNPLTNATQNTFTLEPGESVPPPIESWNVEHGEYFDLRRFYVQGADGDVIEAHYNIIIQA